MPEEMMKESARLKTFESIIWPHNNTPLTPQRLAAAGFYAAPTSKAADRVVCFACENALTNWDPTDDPWLEHQTWYPQCPFVQGRQTGNVPLSKDTSNMPVLSFPPAKMDPKVNNAVAEAAPPAGGPVEPPLTFDSGKNVARKSGSSSSSGNKFLTVAKKGLNNYIQSLQSTSSKAADSEEGKDIVFRGSSKGKNALENGEALGTDPISPASQVLAMWQDAIESSDKDDSSHQRQSQPSLSHPQPSQHQRPSQRSHMFDYPSAGEAQEKGTLDSPLAGKGDDGWELPVMSAESDRDIHRTSKTKHEHSENHHHPHIHHQGKISNLKQNIQCEGSHQDVIVQRVSQDVKGQENSLNGVRERELISQKIRDAMDEVSGLFQLRQNEVMDRMETKMTKIRQRVDLLNNKMSMMGASWSEAKEQDIRSTQERLKKLRTEETSLVGRIQKLQEEMKKHSSDLAKVRKIEETMQKAHADLSSTREEESRLRQSLQQLIEEVSSRSQERLHLQNEVVDLTDTVNRRKTEIDVMETKLRELAERESKLRALELDIRTRESSLVEREARVKAREEWVAKRDGQVKAVESVLLAREKKVREMEGSTQARWSDGSDPELSQWAGGFKSPSRGRPTPPSPSRARPGSTSVSAATGMPRGSRDTPPKRGGSHIPAQYVNPW